MNNQLTEKLSDEAQSPLLRVGDVIASAFLSKCKKYRYSLTRIWDERKPKIMFVMLNPSTADGTQDDPTIRHLHIGCVYPIVSTNFKIASV